jgi:hypothetical protein
MSLSSLLVTLGLKPKNLEEARNAIEPAKATLDNVNALFTAAGLNLETLLAAGPESLKAHLASLDNAAQVSALTADLATAKAALSKSDGEVVALSDVVQHITTAIALPVAKDAKVGDIKTAFETHVAKQVVLANAKAGHPPVQQIDADAAAATAAASDEAIAKEYSAMPAGTERLAFYGKHAAALQRVYDAQNRRDE